MTGTVVSPPPTVAEAYRHCEVVTRRQARNFAYGIRLLHPPQRRALSAVYALARRIDDIGDGGLPDADKLHDLAAVRASVEQLGRSGAAPGDDPVLIAVADVAHRYPVPIDAFVELVHGVEMDVHGVTYETFDDLVLYCRRVAGTVGRLCLGIYDATDRPRAERHADALGVALQQTNILRDVREDLAGGRVYLPAADLRRHGVELRIGPGGVLGGPPHALRELVLDATARAERWYADGLQLLDLLDRRSAACTAAMAGIYVHLNRRLAHDPAALTTGRVSLPGREKAVIAARALLGRRP